MDQGYVFAGAFVAMSGYNAFRAWWNLRDQRGALGAAWYAWRQPMDGAARAELAAVLGKKQLSVWDCWTERFFETTRPINQKVIMGFISILFCLMSLAAAGVIGTMAWRDAHKAGPAQMAPVSE